MSWHICFAEDMSMQSLGATYALNDLILDDIYGLRMSSHICFVEVKHMQLLGAMHSVEMGHFQ